MNKRTLVGLGLTAALAGTVTAPAITAAPVAAYADEAVVEVADAAALQSALNEGKSVKLTANIAGSVTVPAGKSVTLDLNGHTLTATKQWAAITNNGTLVVKGTGTVDGSNLDHIAALYNAPGATATLEGGTFTGSMWYVIKNLGKLTIDGASIDQKYALSSAIDNGYFNNKANDCNESYPASGSTVESVGILLNIKSGTFTGGMNVVKNDDYAKLEISGGSFSGTEGPAVLNWSEATISGGDYSVSDKAAAVISSGSYQNAADKGELTITGGTFTAANSGTGSVLAPVKGGKDGGTVTFEGGTFKGDFTATKSSGITATFGEGVEFSDLNTLISASEYLSDDSVVVTEDGSTFTVATASDAQKESNVHKTYSFTQGNSTDIYFTGEDAKDNAAAFTGGNSESGDTAQKADAEHVKVQISYLDTDDQELADPTDRNITAAEYADGKLTVDLTGLPTVSKDDHVFAAWQANLGGDDLEDLTGTSLTVEYDEELLTQLDNEGYAVLYVSFYASWYNDHVTVKFDTDGGSAVDDLGVAVDSNGEAVLKQSIITEPTKAGYTFAGWVIATEDGFEKVVFPMTFGATRNGDAIDTFILKATWAKEAETPKVPSTPETPSTPKTPSTPSPTVTKTTTTTTTEVAGKALPATGDNTAAVVAGVAAAGAVLVTAAAATKRRGGIDA